jgi:hypothetical protein
MNIAKNMEIIFLVTLGLVSATSLASAAAPVRHHATSPVALRVDAAVPMAVVTITGKRLSAAQKAQLGN